MINRLVAGFNIDKWLLRLRILPVFLLV